MFPEPTPPPPPPPPRIKAPAWLCDCGNNNQPVIVNGSLLVSKYFCERCGKKGTHDFDISLVDVNIRSIQIIPPVRNQRCHPTCTIHSSLAAMEILLRRQWAYSGVVFNKTLQWEDVKMKYEQLMGCVFDGDEQKDKCFGRLQGILHVLQNSGVVDEDGTVHRIKSYIWRPFSSMSFAQVCSALAQGFPVLTVVPFLPHMLNLRENDVYSTKWVPHSGLIDYHVIVLISGLRESGNEIFRFLDSHGRENQVNGIGKIFLEECAMGYGIIDL